MNDWIIYGIYAILICISLFSIIKWIYRRKQLTVIISSDNNYFRKGDILKTASSGSLVKIVKIKKMEHNIIKIIVKPINNESK